MPGVLLPQKRRGFYARGLRIRAGRRVAKPGSWDYRRQRLDACLDGRALRITADELVDSIAKLLRKPRLITCFAAEFLLGGLMSTGIEDPQLDGCHLGGGRN